MLGLFAGAGGVEAAANARCKGGPAGHCSMSIHSYGSATSPDGVHWTDHGTMMTQFDEGVQCPSTGSGSGSVWKAYKNGRSGGGAGSSSSSLDKGDMYVINYSHGGVIRFMTAPTPRGPWTPVGSTAKATKTLADGFGPGRRPARPQDGRQWYNGRWDTANGWPAPPADSTSNDAPGSAPKMYFWISATAIGANNTKQVGHASSVDGVNWTAQPPAVVTDWGNHSFQGGPFESGGCAFVASVKKWYCLNGFRGSWMSVDGTRGMGTFVSDHPGGPYAIAKKNPLIMAYKSCAYLPQSCDAATYFARFWLRYDTPDPSSPPELLVVHQSYSQTTSMTYLAPLKLAVVDEEGTMRLHYWPKNDLMKGPKLPLVTSSAASHSEERVIKTALNNRNGTVLEGKLPTCQPGAIIFKGTSTPPPPAPTPHYKPVPNVTYSHCGTVEVGVSYDGHDIPGWTAHDVGGVDMCCKMCAAHSLCKYWSMDRPSSNCFLKSAKPPGPCNHWPMTVSGTPGAGCRPHYNPSPPPPPLAAIVDYEVAVDEALVFSIATVSADGKRTLLDRFDRSIPVPSPTEVDISCHFKLLLRGSMVELYINDILSEQLASYLLPPISLPLCLPLTYLINCETDTSAQRCSRTLRIAEHYQQWRLHWLGGWPPRACDHSCAQWWVGQCDARGMDNGLTGLVPSGVEQSTTGTHRMGDTSLL